MKKHSIRIMVACALIAGCAEKAHPVCDIDVHLEKSTYSVGEEVVFNFSGHADNIMFFSGEPGHAYDNRNVHFDDRPLFVKFRTYTDGKYDDNCRFMVSYDFNGTYDKDNLGSATWHDLTADFGFTTGANMDSEELDLKALLPETADMESPAYYLAFRYFDSDPDAPISNRWCIRSISVSSIDAEGAVVEKANMSSMGWTLVSAGSETPEPIWSVSTQLLAQGTKNGIKEVAGKDEWCISKAFKPNNIPPDTGEVVSFLSIEPDKHTYVYNKPGTYEAVFSCSSVWYNGSESKIVKKIINITE